MSARRASSSLIALHPAPTQPLPPVWPAAAAPDGPAPAPHPGACRSSRPARPGPGHRSTATTGRSRYGVEPSARPLPIPAPSGGRPPRASWCRPGGEHAYLNRYQDIYPTTTKRPAVGPTRSVLAAASAMRRTVGGCDIAGRRSTHHPRGQAGLPCVRRIGRVRTRPHPASAPAPGLAAALARARRGGRPSVTNAHKLKVAREIYGSGSTRWQRSLRPLASAEPRSTGTSPATVADRVATAADLVTGSSADCLTLCHMRF